MSSADATKTKGGVADAAGPVQAPGGLLLARSRLERRLDEAFTRRLASVVADSGFGKSTLVAAWASGRERVCRAGSVTAPVAAQARAVGDALCGGIPELDGELADVLEGVPASAVGADERARASMLASACCEVLRRQLRYAAVLVVDDVHRAAPGTPQAAFLEELVRGAPPALHLVLVGRAGPPFPTDRLRGQGEVLDVGATELAFTEEEVEELLAAALGPDDSGFARELHAVTGGWPAALRLALETLQSSASAAWRQRLASLVRRGGALYDYLASEVLAREPPEVRGLIDVAARLDRFTPELCQALGVADAGETLAVLLRRGLLVEADHTRLGWFSVHALVRSFARERRPEDEAGAGLRRRAATWLRDQGLVADAVECLLGAEEPGAAGDLAHLLAADGAALLASGRGALVLTALARLPDEALAPALLRLRGEALQIAGDWDGALADYDRASAGTSHLEPALAWRMGSIHYLRGTPEAALETYARARRNGCDPVAEAMLTAWTAAAHWGRGDVRAAHEAASAALAAATAAGDAGALACAHTVLAMVAAAEGDRSANEAHYARARRYAERSGDLLQLTRIRTNHGAHLCYEGRFADALAELDAAVPLAELTGFASFRALAVYNRGYARFALGRLEEAVADFEASQELYEALGSAQRAYPLRGLGDVYRHRGDRALARAAYEEAITCSERAADGQALVPALAGLARLLLADDPERADALLERALAFGEGIGHAEALVVAGWAVHARGDRAEALRLAAQAAAVARTRRDRPVLAECLELEAAASGDPARARALLEEAIAAWAELRCPVQEARATLALAGLLGGTGRALATNVCLRMRAIGAREQAAAAAEVVSGNAAGQHVAVTVETLGGFRVLRWGRPAASSEWQSKKARDLLKLLVARRGRPIPREAAMEALWPEEDPGRLGNRLSVALAVARAVLDPRRSFDPDHFVAADKETIALDLSHVEVDLERFVADASEGLALLRQGRHDEATGRLEAAEAAYRGDFLEENPYDDWAVGAREEARVLYLRVARALAERAERAGENDSAVRLLLRALERDPYDEALHLGLVGALARAGHHGQARRCYRVYCARMEELGVEAAPIPA